MVAELDEPLEMNYVRKHASEQAQTLGIGVREAATRVFQMPLDPTHLMSI